MNRAISFSLVLSAVSCVASAEEHSCQSLGLLDSSGEFRQLSPWLRLQTCQVCKRPEVFIFNRYEKNLVTYVAMESGHSWETDDASSAFITMLGETTST